LRQAVLVAAVDRALRMLGTPARGGSIVVGLSGGADSVALLDALVSLQRRRSFRVVAAHLDHGLRPDSAADAAFCASLCARLGVPLRVGAADVRARTRTERGGLEAVARRERYAFLRRVGAEEGASAIAVAHTLDDQAETLLLRLLRGAGATGLGGMRPRSGEIVRPLLGVSRTEVLAHLRERDLPWREDPTNADLAHRRNRVRHELLPYLESRYNPSVRRVLARSAGLLAEEAAHVRGEAIRLLERIGRAEADAVVVSRSELSATPRPLARAVVRAALERAGGLARVSAEHVERILDLTASTAPSGRRLPLPGGREASFRFGEIRLGPRGGDASGFARPLSVPGRVELPGGRAIEACPLAGPADARPGMEAVPVPGGEPLLVRTRRPGDRVFRGGREVSLSRLLMERRIPAEERGRLPLVASGDRVLWVAGEVPPGPVSGEGWVGIRFVDAAESGAARGEGR